MTIEIVPHTTIQYNQRYALLYATFNLWPDEEYSAYTLWSSSPTGGGVTSPVTEDLDIIKNGYGIDLATVQSFWPSSLINPTGPSTYTTNVNLLDYDSMRFRHTNYIQSFNRVRPRGMYYHALHRRVPVNQEVTYNVRYSDYMSTFRRTVTFSVHGIPSEIYNDERLH